jgi:hypothetical protein
LGVGNLGGSVGGFTIGLSLKPGIGGRGLRSGVGSVGFGKPGTAISLLIFFYLNAISKCFCSK